MAHGNRGPPSEDDVRYRQRLNGRRFDAAVVRMMSTDLLTVRLDLEPSTLSKADNEPAVQPQTSAGPADPDRRRNQ
jgi:hypothetical protein